MRDRLGIPLLLPILTVGAILLSIFSFGYVLLQVQESREAWPVAIAVAAAILVIAAFVNSQPTIRGWPLYALTAVPASVILALGLFYLVRPGPETEGGPAVAAIAAPGPLEEVATDNRFSVTSYTIFANQQYTLDFRNSGSALHNWALKGVTGADGRPIQTSLLQGGGSESISFTIAQPGSYQFICDVHPVEMVGTLRVVEETAAAGPAGGAGGAGTAGGPGRIVQVATDNRWALTQLNANANESTSLTLENRGTALHNLSIKGVTGANGQPITTTLLPGGRSETIQFTIAQAGTYDFICDVHPVEMRGRLTVR